MIRYIQPVSAGTARGLVADIYAQIRRDFGTLGEPLTLHSAIPDLLAGVWATFRESLLAGTVRRELKEALAVAVSLLNECPYCVDAHSVMLRANSRDDAATALRQGQDARIGDTEMRSLLAWASSTRTPGAEILQSPPFGRTQAPEIIGTAVWMHYINRMVTVFLDESLLPVSGALKTVAEKMSGLFFARKMRRTPLSGQSLGFLTPAPLSGDLNWAADSPVIGPAFAAMEASCESAGRLALPDETRETVLEQLGRWSGEDPGLSRAWLQEPLGKLRTEHRSAGALALLTALAPHQVDEETLVRFRSDHPGDGRILAGTAWASFAAARKIGSWLSGPVS